MSKMYEKIRNGGVYVIAEMSANHGGKLQDALEIVREAAKAGADCLKIQTYTADSITLDCDSYDFEIHGGLWDGYKMYELYTDAETPYEWHQEIKNECEACGMDFLSTPFDKDAVDFLEELGCESYKIASFELVDIPLIEYVASKRKPMIISCGMGSKEEIREAVEACYRMGNKQIVLLKCCSEYPANWENMHMANILDMKKEFDLPVGLSDHSKGCIASVVGVACGAQIIEKHIKLDTTKSADSDFSMTTDEFSEMVDKIKIAKTIIGSVYYGPTVGEMDNVKFRRSLFATEDIKKGELFSESNVRSVRPSSGMKPKYMSLIKGKRANCDIKFGEPILKEKVEGYDDLCEGKNCE